jgi:hypothetical protein
MYKHAKLLILKYRPGLYNFFRRHIRLSVYDNHKEDGDNRKNVFHWYKIKSEKVFPKFKRKRPFPEGNGL